MNKFVTLVLAISLSFGQVSAFNFSDTPNDILNFIFDKKFAVGCLTGVIFASLGKYYSKRKKAEPTDLKIICQNCKAHNDTNLTNCIKCNQSINYLDEVN